MELKLNIWKKGQIEKTYIAQEYDVTLGTCEDLINLLGLEKYSEKDLNELPVSDLISTVVKNFDKFVDLLHDIFPDLLEEDHRGIKIIELKDIFVELAKYTLNKLFSLNKNSKN